ncbi:MAG: ATP-binding protein [Euryarchaeota archaeon]|nr:ATP-binding protein [Euryarchaeota archaeon]
MNTIGTNSPSKNQRKSLFEFKSIKTELVVIIIVMLIVSGTVLTAFAAFMASSALEQAEIEKLTAVGGGTSHKLELITEMGKGFTSILSIDPGTIAMLTQYLEDGTVIREEQIELSEYLTEFQAGLTIPLSMAAIYNLDGIIIASSDQSTLGRDDSSQNFFVHQQEGAYVGEPFLDTGDIPVIPYAQPIYDEEGRQIGLAAINHQYSGFAEVIFSTPGLSDDSTNFLVGSDGMILSGVRGDYSSFLTKKFDLSIFSAATAMVQAPGYFGHMEYIVKAPVPGTSWFIITTESVKEVNDQIMGLIIAMVVSLLIVIVVGALGTLFITNIFTRPILNLTEIAEELALGAVNVSITHIGSNEVGQLADALRRIVENTKQRLHLAQKIALGDIIFKMPVLSDQDEEGHAHIQMKNNLVAMTGSLQTLARQAAEGNLSYRADASQFQGAYRELIETLNQTFDQIITLLQETIRLSVSYSSGDYSDRFDPDITLKGDFVPVKDALNQIGINSSDISLKNISEVQYAKLAATYEACRHQYSALQTAENELEEKNMLLSALLEVSVRGVITADSHLRVIYFNKYFCDMWNLPEDLVFIGADGEEILSYCLKQTIDPAPLYSASYTIIDVEEMVWDNNVYLSDGRVFHVISSPVRGEDGIYHGRVWEVTDISDDLFKQQELKRTHTALIEKSLQLALALESAGEGLWTWDIRTDLFLLNPEFASQYHSISEVQPIEQFFQSAPSSERERCLNTFRDITDICPIEFEFQLQSNEGIWRCFILRGIVSEVDDNGVPLTATGTLVDITERKRYEKHLRESNHKMVVLSQITRHDVMNQLNVLFGISDALSDNISDSIADEETKYLLELLERALITTTHQIEFQRDYQELGVHGAEWQDVHACIEKVKSLLILRPNRQERKVELLTDNLPMLFADPLLEKAVYNLVENSLRHGERVTQIKVTFSVQDGRIGMLTFKDDGIGIPDVHKNRIFDKDFGKNTGHGLFLIREIFSLTGMSIHECGVHGQGAQFEIRIPAGYWKWK